MAAIARAAGLVGAALAAGIGATYTQLFRRPLPTLEGDVQVDGLSATVTVRRDRWGAPHIRAASADDAWFALGYAHAQDRLAQMALFRRLAAGRLAEVAGPDQLPSDRLMRTLGLRHAAEQDLAKVGPRLMASLEGYCAGVAAYVERAPALPFELQLLRGGFEPWRPVDMLANVRVLSFGLSTNWERELLRADMARTLGPELAARLDPGYPRGNPVTTAPGAGWDGDGLALAAQIVALRDQIGLAPEATGSNCWVVSGERTHSGRPLLAGDPHLTSSMPGVWYQASVEVGGRFARGATLAGFPGFWMGHSTDLAWSFTNVMADTMDLFVERIDGDTYEFEGSRIPLEVRRETIKVKGASDEVLAVRSTHHGPIVTDVLGADPAQPLSLAWASLGEPAFGPQQTSILELRSGADLAAVFDGFNGPVTNLLWCDSDGNIGYQLVGRLPVRTGGCPDLPKPGWSGEYDWDGFVPFDELPSVTNPERGYLVTANNRIVDDSYPHHITSDWLDGYRARRIAELIEGADRHGPDDFQRMQTDVLSIPGLEVARRLAALPQADGPRERLAIRLLAGWDGRLDPETIAGTIYQAFTLRLARAVLEAAIGDGELIERYLDRSDGAFMEVVTSPWRWQSHLMALWAEGDEQLIGGSWDELAHRALRDALDELTARFGSNRDAWRWGEVHPLRFPHLLADGGPLLDRLFSRSATVGGGQETICQVAYNPTAPYDGIWAPSWRIVADPGDPDGARWQAFTGQSGQPASPHYDDLIERWAAGEMQPTAGEGPWKTLRLVASVP